jgi:hypothetical protein
MKKQLLALSVMLFVGALGAQPTATKKDDTVAKVTTYDGLVTANFKDVLSNVAVDMRLFEKTRVMTGAAGTVEIVYDSGCRVTLKPNEFHDVSDEGCAAWLLAQSGGVLLPLAPVAGTNAVLAGAAVVGVGILVAGNKQSGS